MFRRLLKPDGKPRARRRDRTPEAGAATDGVSLLCSSAARNGLLRRRADRHRPHGAVGLQRGLRAQHRFEALQ